MHDVAFSNPFDLRICLFNMHGFDISDIQIPTEYILLIELEPPIVETYIVVKPIKANK